MSFTINGGSPDVSDGVPMSFPSFLFPTKLSSATASTISLANFFDSEEFVSNSVPIGISIVNNVFSGGAGRESTSMGRSSTDLEVFDSATCFDSNLGGFGGRRCVFPGGKG